MGKIRIFHYILPYLKHRGLSLDNILKNSMIIFVNVCLEFLRGTLKNVVENPTLVLVFDYGFNIPKNIFENSMIVLKNLTDPGL